MLKKYSLIGIIAIIGVLMLSAFSSVNYKPVQNNAQSIALADTLASPTYSYYFIPYMEMSFLRASPIIAHARASSPSIPKYYYFVPYMEMSFLGTPPMIY
jgi:hypothetical protein